MGMKGLTGTNALAYWAHSYVTKIMKSCECSPGDCIHNSFISFQLIEARVVDCNGLESLDRHKCTSLLCPLVSNKESKVL